MMWGLSKRICGWLLGGMVCSAGLSAQTATGSWRDYDYIRQSDGWLSSYNAAGLRHLSVDNISIAELHADQQQGKLINYYEAEQSFDAGARVESYCRLNDRVVFYGKLSYDYFRGKRMGGSVFISPYDNPFDIVEYADSTRGDKTKENYHLIGAVSIELRKGFTLGGMIDYNAANYAKSKDLRHTNKLLDMTATVGLSYQFSPSFEGGIGYLYRRNTEGLHFAIYGTTDQQYNSLVSYGAFYGKSEFFGDTGYTKKGEEKPLFNRFNGLFLQAALTIGEAKFYNELVCKSRDGYYGKRSPNTVVYSEHESDILEYTGHFSLSQKSRQHHLLLQLSSEALDNYENIYRTETKPGGVSEVVYYNRVKVADKKQRHATLTYRLHCGIQQSLPVWTFEGGAAYRQHLQTLSVYPYYRKQEIKQYRLQLSLLRNLIHGENLFTCQLSAAYSFGDGTMKEEGTYATPSESQTEPKQIDRYLLREYEYLTAKRMNLFADIRYSRHLTTLPIQGYAAIRYGYGKAAEVSALEGDSRHELSLRIGCLF